jgi:hypothetical protein
MVSVCMCTRTIRTVMHMEQRYALGSGSGSGSGSSSSPGGVCSGSGFDLNSGDVDCPAWNRRIATGDPPYQPTNRSVSNTYFECIDTYVA